MPAFSHPRKAALSLLAAIALVACAAIANSTTANAQNAPSIVGSSPLPGLSGATEWINSKPLTAKQLKGKVVVVDFWTYSCINCLRAVPYVRAWADKYKDQGLVVIGVHTPEFDFEKQLPNVQKAVQKFGMTYPIVLDSDRRIWNAFHNQYWPAHYFLDRNGKVRYEHFGEGEYDQSEKWIQEALNEGATKPNPSSTASVNAQGIEAAPDMKQVHSPETYLGYSRADRFASPSGIKMDIVHPYTAPENPKLNEWGFSGTWLDQVQSAESKAAGGKILFRFHARDLHLVLGPATHGKTIRYRVTIDGKAPGENHGVDTDAQGNGVVTDHRLYQLVRQHGTITDHIFVIEFLDPGVEAFAFTFG